MVRTASIYAILLDPRIFILQKQRKEISVVRWGLTGMPIDMSSFHLLNKCFFSSELRRHAETALHHGLSPFADENV